MLRSAVRAVLALGVAQAFAWTAAAAQLTAGPNDLYLRVVDVGPGLCVVAAIPDHHYLVYDTGHWVGGRCVEAVRELVGSHDIDLLILSHGDGDHIGDAPAILDEFNVDSIAWTGDQRTSDSWKAAKAAIAKEKQAGADVLNLQTSALTPGDTVSLGAATLTYVAGWKNWTTSGPDSAERHNVISIVAKLEYQGTSVLLTGDTIGKRRSDPDSACKDAEKRMVERHNDGTVPLTADVIIAPHHGGNNGSSRCFIEAVDPSFVVFSAGHQYHHPSRKAALRYLANGVSADHCYRTDRGDHEKWGGEWSHERIKNCSDPRGDDDVELVIRENGDLEIDYREEQAGC